MKTKEQCLLDRIMSNIEYGRNPRLVNVLTSVYNQGKNYLADCSSLFAYIKNNISPPLI